MTEDGFVPIPEDGSFIGHVGGMEWCLRDGGATTRMRVARHHTNPIGIAHGGVLMTLLDITLGATAQAALAQGDAGPHPATVSLTCNLLAAAREGELLQGEARVDTATRSLSFVSGRLHVTGRTVATASAVFRNPPPTGRSA
jgi:uncharacterized protein (TIGR00369 family)